MEGHGVGLRLVRVGETTHIIVSKKLTATSLTILKAIFFRSQGAMMEKRLLRRRAVMGGAIIALSLWFFFALKGWSAESTMGGGHKDHQMMRSHDNPQVRKPGLATPKGWRFALPPGNEEAGGKKIRTHTGCSFAN